MVCVYYWNKHWKGRENTGTCSHCVWQRAKLTFKWLLKGFCLNLLKLHSQLHPSQVRPKNVSFSRLAVTDSKVIKPLREMYNFGLWPHPYQITLTLLTCHSSLWIDVRLLWLKKEFIPSMYTKLLADYNLITQSSVCFAFECHKNFMTCSDAAVHVLAWICIWQINACIHNDVFSRLINIQNMRYWFKPVTWKEGLLPLLHVKNSKPLFGELRHRTHT